jgi:hypothetical protein
MHHEPTYTHITHIYMAAVLSVSEAAQSVPTQAELQLIHDWYMIGI